MVSRDSSIPLPMIHPPSQARQGTTLAMSNLGLNLATLHSGLPLLTGISSLLAISGGLYDLQAPSQGSKVFGILVADEDSNTSSSSPPTPVEKAYIQVHGIRTIASGLSCLGLLLFLHFSDLTRTSPTAATAMRKAIGVITLAIAPVCLLDSWVLAGLAQSQGVSGDTAALARQKSAAHAFTSIPIVALGASWFFS